MALAAEAEVRAELLRTARAAAHPPALVAAVDAAGLGGRIGHLEEAGPTAGRHVVDRPAGGAAEAHAVGVAAVDEEGRAALRARGWRQREEGERRVRAEHRLQPENLAVRGDEGRPGGAGST